MYKDMKNENDVTTGLELHMQCLRMFIVICVRSINTQSENKSIGVDIDND